MKAALKAIVPALALATALALPSAAEAGHRHGRGCGHKGYRGDYSYYRGGHGHGGHYARPYRYGYAPYRRYARPYYVAPPPPYVYGYYPPPPVYYHGRPHDGVTLHLGF